MLTSQDLYQAEQDLQSWHEEMSHCGEKTSHEDGVRQNRSWFAMIVDCLRSVTATRTARQPERSQEMATVLKFKR